MSSLVRTMRLVPRATTVLTWSVMRPSGRLVVLPFAIGMTQNEQCPRQPRLIDKAYPCGLAAWLAASMCLRKGTRRNETWWSTRWNSPATRADELRRLPGLALALADQGERLLFLFLVERATVEQDDVRVRRAARAGGAVAKDEILVAVEGNPGGRAAELPRDVQALSAKAIAQPAAGGRRRRLAKEMDQRRRHARTSGDESLLAVNTRGAGEFRASGAHRRSLQARQLSSNYGMPAIFRKIGTVPVFELAQQLAVRPDHREVDLAPAAPLLGRVVH